MVTFKRGSEKKILKLFFVASKNSTARNAGARELLSSSKSPHGQGAFFEPLHKKPSPRQGPRRVGVRASHGQSGYAPSGILKVFLVRSPVGDLKRFILPEGEKEFYSFSCRRPQKIYSLVIGRWWWWCRGGLLNASPSERFFLFAAKIAVLEPLGPVGF